MLAALSSNSSERESSKKSLSLAHTVLILLDWSLHSQLLRLNAVCCRREATGLFFSFYGRQNGLLCKARAQSKTYV